jgi:hypothetical protein
MKWHCAKGKKGTVWECARYRIRNMVMVSQCIRELLSYSVNDKISKDIIQQGNRRRNSREQEGVQGALCDRDTGCRI